MSLVESPGSGDGDPHLVGLLEADPEGLDGSLEERSVGLIENEALLLQELAGVVGLGLSYGRSDHHREARRTYPFRRGRHHTSR